MKRFLWLLAAVVSIAFSADVDARPRGIQAVSNSPGFNNGKFQTHLNYPGIGGNYPFINELLESQGFTYADNSGAPSPSEFSASGYPIPGATGFSRGGFSAFVRIASTLDAGNARVLRTTGKGTTSIGSTNGVVVANVVASSLTTGANTAIVLSSTPTYAFRKGMEAPLSGSVTGVTLVNATGTITAPTGAQTAWTVCNSYNGVTLTIPLCLNDATTPLQTTGTATGAPTVTYGRFASGVTTNGRVVYTFTGSPVATTVTIASVDATTPISDMALMQPKWESQWDACTVGNRACFSPDLIALLAAAKPAWHRDLNLTTQGNSLSGIASWANRKPVNYATYGSGYANSAIYAAATSTSGGVSTGNDYQISLGSGGPVHGQQILTQFTANPVTVSIDATASQIAWTNHNLVAGQPFQLYASDVPTAASVSMTASLSGNSLIVTALLGTNSVQVGGTISCSGCTAATITAGPAGGGTGTYTFSGGAQTVASTTVTETFSIPLGTAGTSTPMFVASVINANTFTYSLSQTGGAIATTGAGANVFAHATMVTLTCTTTGAPTTTINCPGHLLSVGDPIACASPPAPLIQPGNYYVQNVINADNISLSATIGGGATPLSITANAANFKCIRQPTLDLNGSGAIPIKGPDGNGVLISSRDTRPLFANGSKSGVTPIIVYGSVFYDSVIGAWLKTGADSSLGNQYLNTWWPPEIALEFAKQIGAHPWFVSPMYTADPATDYLPELMTMVKNNKASWQIPGFETPNENWNNVFYPTVLSINHGYIYKRDAGWPNGTVGTVNAKMASVLGQTAANIFGASFDGSLYQVIDGYQTGSFASVNYASSGAPRITAAEYVGQSTPPQSLTWSGGTINYAKDPAYKWITHTAVAQYFTPSLYQNPTVRNSLGASFNAGRIKTGTIDATGAGTGAAGNVLNVTSFSYGSGSIDIGTQLFAPGIPGSSGITSPMTVTAMSPTSACNGSPCTGTGGNGTYALSASALVGSSSSPTPINFIPTTSNTSAVQTFIDSSEYNASFTATVVNGSATVVVTGVAGTITSATQSTSGSNGDQILTASGAVTNWITFASQSSGVTGKDGTYTLSAVWPGTTQTASFKSGYTFAIATLNNAYINAATFSGSYCNGNGTCIAPGSYPIGVRGYEGGYSPDAGLGNLSDTMIYFGKFVTSTPLSANGVQGYVTTNCNNFTASGGKFCSLFQLNGLGPSADDWSALPDYYIPGGSAYFSGYTNGLN